MRSFLSVSAFVVAFVVLTLGISAELRRSTPALLPTGQTIDDPGASVTFFGRPSDMALSHDGRTLAIKNSHGLIFVDAFRMKVLQTLPLPNPGREFPAHLGGNGAAGIVWSDDDRAIWQADAFNTLREAVRRSNGHYEWTFAIVLHPHGTAAPIGIALAPNSHAGFVALSADNAVACIDTTRLRVTCRISTGVAPFGVLYARGRIFVSNWGGRRAQQGDPVQLSDGTPVVVSTLTGAATTGTVSVVDPKRLSVIATIPVGLHPSAMIASREGRFVYVANAESDSVSELSTSSLHVTRTFHLGQAGIALRSPQALALSADARSLWIAESISNDVAQLDLESGVVQRRIATEWYPSAVACCANGRLFVSNLKGVGSRGLAYHLPIIVGRNRPGGMNVYDYAGTVQALPLAGAPPAAPISSTSSRELRGLFHHVVYIIKENHTYDDIYGDVAEGNGDKRLCTFCAVTPNQHALARRFGIFDNFYVNGVLSADGHNWADSAVATDYVERSLSAFARSYPSAGNDPLAYSSSGFIWDRVVKARLRFRDYGEFVPDVVDYEPSTAQWRNFYRDYRDGTQRVRFRIHPGIASLAPYVDPNYPSFSLRIPDQIRASEFIKELNGFERSGNLPNLMLIALGNDHTAGTDSGYPTPEAFAADNDLALGRIVEALSHSQFWRDTVVFVVEDDAQDGYDHVDAHRTAALVISARNRGGSVDHHFYNQASVLRTIEELFGLQPMTLFDATAPPIVTPFMSTITAEPYTALPAVAPLDRMNPSGAGAAIEVRFKDANEPGALSNVLHSRQ